MNPQDRWLLPWHWRRAPVTLTGMMADSLSTWLGFLTSPAAPRTALSPMELDGYLTGVVVAPDLVLPSRWLGGLGGAEEPVFDSAEQMHSVMRAVMDHYNSLSRAIDDGFEKLEAKEPYDYRPLFLAAGDKPKHDVVRAWADGFTRAIPLSPEGWMSLAKDERTQPLLTPFIVFTGGAGPAFESAEDKDELLDEAAAEIPRMVILLRKLAQFRNESRPGRKIGRNDRCPCGSGQKYKRCCGAD